MPVKDAHSALSRPPDFVLLNAVPGVDDNEASYYLGDGPWDTAADVADQIAPVMGPVGGISEEEARAMVMERVLPTSLAELDPETTNRLVQIVDAFWKTVDQCYEFDWGRTARPAERRWVCEYAVERLCRKS